MMYVADMPTPEHLEELYCGYGHFKGYASSGLQRAKAALSRRCLPCHELWLQVLQRSGGLKGLRIIDFGASHGHNALICRGHGATVIAVEVDQLAQQHLSSIRFRVASRIEDVADTADVICALQVFEHLEDPLAVIRAMREKSHTGGRLLVSVPNAGEVETYGPTWVGFRVDLEHFNYFTPRSLSQMLAAGGFSADQVWQHGQPVLSARRPSFLRRLFHRATGIPELADCGSFNLTVLARPV